MALFWEEWKKCWRGRTAPLCLLALLAAAVCLGVYTGVDALSDMDRYYQPMHNGPREAARQKEFAGRWAGCLLYTSPSPRDRQKSRMPSSA